MATKGDQAKEILRDHYGTLADTIIAPVKLGQELFQKRVISDSSLREIETDGWPISKKNTSLLRSVRVAIGQDHMRLGKLAQLLVKYEETSSVGAKLLQKYEETFGGEELANSNGPVSKSNSLEEELPFPKIDQILGSDDLLFVCDLLKDFNDWEDLGLYLGLKKATLDRIQLEKHDIKSRRREMLSCWLLGKSDDIAHKRTCTIAKLIDALSEIGDYTETIESIRDKIDK